MVPNYAALRALLHDLGGEREARILVEGKRDIAALSGLGIPKERIVQTAQMNYSQLEKTLPKETKLIPLFDNDRTGLLRLKRFIGYFSANGFSIDYSYSARCRTAGLTCLEDIGDLL